MKFSTKNKFLLFLFANIIANTSLLFAQVNIVQPTNGQNISNDKSTLGPTAEYTILDNIVISETAPGDFTQGTNVTLKFDRPVGWQFNPSKGSAVGSGANISNVSVTSVTDTSIIVTYTIVGITDGSNAITISGIEVQSTTGDVGSQVSIFRQGGTGVINGLVGGNENTGTKVAKLSKLAGNAVKLLTLLPNQSLSPGSATGKSGTPTTPTVGIPFNVVVYATDYAWNPANNTDSIAITSNDIYAILPANNTLDNKNGRTFSVELRAAIVSPAPLSRIITASNISNPLITASTTTATMVNTGAFTKLLVLLPNETLDPGSVNGKTIGANAPVAGVNYPVTVYSVDTFWNRVNSTNSVAITATGATNFTPPAGGAMSGGVRIINLVFKKVGETPTITASNITDTSRTAFTQTVPMVVAGSFVKLQVLMPGEVSAPGTATGKTGTPNVQTAGVEFDVTVNAVDANWNIIAGITDTIAITNVNASDTITSILPSKAKLVDGSGMFSVTLNRAATDHSLSATNISDNTKLSNNTSLFTVTPFTFSKLLILMPGEIHAPGTATGKTGTATPRTANISFNISVYAVDQYSNIINTVTDVIEITSSDSTALMPNNAALVAGQKTNFAVTLKIIGTTTLTATNVTDGSKLSYTTLPFDVTAGPFTKLVLILPGEYDVQGIAAGKAGTPIAQVAGVKFDVIVKASDAFGNTVTSVNDTVRFSATGDRYAQLPANMQLHNGLLITEATYRIGSTTKDRRLSVANVTNPSIAVATSPTFVVNTGAYVGLLMILPGQIHDPGSPNGKLDAIANQAVGSDFNITVMAVDIAFNQIIGITDVVTITSSDSLATFTPDSAALVDGIKTDFSVRLTESATLTATSNDPTKSPYTSGIIVVAGSTSTNHYFRSVVNGTWNNSSTWESSTTVTGPWQPATVFPTSAANGILIVSGHSINITADLTVDDVTVQSGAQVNVNNGTLTVADGTAPNDFVVAGVLRNNGRTITTTGSLQITTTGKYQHNFTTTSGVLPTAQWMNGSVCEIIGYTNYVGLVNGSDQVFSDFVWNATNQTAVGNASLSGNFNVRNFSVNSTGAGRLNLTSSGGTASISGNYVQSAGRVIVNGTSGTQDLSIAGNFIVNGGVFETGTGLVNLKFNGSSSQSMVNLGPTIEFQNVIFSNGGLKTLTSGNFNLLATGVLTMQANTELNANGNLTLNSTASSSATISPIPSSAKISGNVRVERFITGGSDMSRTYRMFSSPVYDNGNASARTYSFTQFIDDMLITGNGHEANGFDYSPGGRPAGAWYYSDGYRELPNIHTSIEVGRGAYVYYRGDRVNDIPNKVKFAGPFAKPEYITMDFVGVLNQQNVVVPLSYNVNVEGFNLLGNPYPSSIDWNNTSKTDLIDASLSIFNPNLRQYAIYLNGVSANGGSNIINAGQGFFVKAKPGGGSFTFKESDKIASVAPVLLLSQPSETDLTLNGNGKLAFTHTNKEHTIPQTKFSAWLKKEGTPYKVETVVVFEEGKSADYVIGEDATYNKGTEVFMSSVSQNNKDLVINFMPAVTPQTVVPLNVHGSNDNGDYALELNYSILPQGYLLKLNDNYLGTSAVVANGTNYNFTIDKTNEATFGASRFSISFEAPTTLPVTLSSFTANKVNGGVAIKWKSESEINHNRFELERAGDDKMYTKLYTTEARGSGSAYTFLDRNPLLGNNYYRLVQISNSNTSTTSAPIAINYNGVIENALINVFPNPIKDQFTVKFNGNLKEAQQIVKITNITGRVLMTKAIAAPLLTAGYTIDVTHLATGMYMLEIFENGNQRVGQTKLIKQ